ncbi:hypothetical protein QCA50_014740 [Cerrena zonata]|uniref:Nuclear pore complex protein n=1 Tax=Cerrena zonata TaxID=2478898 RepID=A0AAW0FM91_9APHY
MADALYSSCAEVLSLAQSHKDDLNALLDPVDGFAPRLRQICQERLIDLEANPSASQEELDVLRMESDTWGLLQAIMPLRKLAPQTQPDPQSLLIDNPYTPTADLANAIMGSSPFFTELVAVREWLHETAPYPPADPGPVTGYWKFTKYEVLQNKRLGKGKEREPAGGYVLDLDPDAPNRGEGRSLAADDAVYDRALVQALYVLVRAGKLDEAIELCQTAQQPWRAATIRGTQPFQWRALNQNQSRDEDAMEEDDFDGWRGNQRLKLWKYSCEKAALNPNLSDIERALYAALAPCAQTYTFLKAACRTWEDHLWAQLSILCEEKVSAELEKLKNMFWEDSLTLKETDGVDVSMNVEEDEEEDWATETMAALESLSEVPVEEGPPADDPYHATQLQIILDRTDHLLESFAASLDMGEHDPESPQYPALTRFFAHLCLYLQMIDMSSPPLATQRVLEAYLQVLESTGQRDLIAMYAGALGDNAVERYAMFLTSLGISGEKDDRRLALIRAKDHGLDMKKVALVTAERTVEKALATLLPPPEGLLPDFSEHQPPATDEETFLLRSIEWTTLLESTYDMALEQANVILRYFLGRGRLLLAKKFLDGLPKDLNSLREPEAPATEFLHYRQLFMVWEVLDRVVECQGLEKPHMAVQTKADWLQDYKLLTQQAREQVTRLLTTEWLLSEDERMKVDSRRLLELVRIRQIYIPIVIMRLHNVLYDSRRKISENLKYVLLLANTVADSRYKLYEDFVAQDGRRLGDYLQLVREATLGGLEGGGSDPFRILHTL